MLDRGKDLVSLPPNLQFRVPVENLEGLNNLVLVVCGGAVTHVVEDLIPDVLVLVVGELKHSFPKLGHVPLYVARAHLLNSSHLHFLVLVLGELDQFFDRFSFLDLVQDVPKLLLGFSLGLLFVDLGSLVTSLL